MVDLDSLSAYADGVTPGSGIGDKSALQACQSPRFSIPGAFSRFRHSLTNLNAINYCANMYKPLMHRPRGTCSPPVECSAAHVTSSSSAKLPSAGTSSACAAMYARMYTSSTKARLLLRRATRWCCTAWKLELSSSFQACSSWYTASCVKAGQRTKKDICLPRYLLRIYTPIEQG